MWMCQCVWESARNLICMNIKETDYIRRTECTVHYIDNLFLFDINKSRNSLFNFQLFCLLLEMITSRKKKEICVGKWRHLHVQHNQNELLSKQETLPSGENKRTNAVEENESERIDAGVSVHY